MMKNIKRTISLMLVLTLALTLIPVMGLSVEVKADPVISGKWTDGLSPNAGYGFGGGAGTQENPYKISTAEHLAMLAVNTSTREASDAVGKYENKYFELTTDIDLAGKNWLPIASCNDVVNSYMFGGNIDGAGHSIKNMTIDTSVDDRIIANDNGGNIGFIAATSGTIKDLGVEDAEITISDNINDGDHGRTGIIAGYVYRGSCSIENCYATGNIIGGEYVYSSYLGGLVGSTRDSHVTNCFYKGTIDMSLSNVRGDNIAGLVGYANGGSVTNSYSCATIDSSQSAAFATFSGSTHNHNYYDSTLYSTASDSDPIGRTTNEMKTADTAELLGDAWRQSSSLNDGYPIQSKFVADSYSVTLNANEGTIAGGHNITSYTVGQETKLPTAEYVTKANYEFGGWYDNSSLTGDAVTAISASEAGDKEYWAKWTPNSYDVTLHPNEGTINEGDVTSYTYGIGATLPTNVTKANYTFGGWYDNSSCTGTQVTQISTTASGAKEYWAKWTATEYSIAYDLAGGNVSGTNPTSYTVDTATFTLINPTKTAYTFAGWTGTGLTEATTSVTITQGSTGDRSYTATWTPVNYNITYDLAGGSVEGNPTTYNIESDAITLINPTKDGYTFAGWTGTDLSQATTAVTIPAGSSGNRTYTATWTATSYNITYELDGGSANNPESYNKETPTFTLNNPTKTGYTFTGWSGTDLTDDDNTTVAISIGSTGNRVYTAHWQANTYTVTLNDNNGSGGSGTVTATYDANIPNVTVPTRTGYTFQGYFSGDTQYINADGTSAKTWDITQDTTLTARWTAKTYTVTLDRNSGTGGDTSVTATYDANIPNVTVPTRTGYTFQGYFSGNTKYIDTNGTGTKVWDITQDTTLIAKWSADTYTVTLTTNGGTINEGNVTSYTYGTGATLPTNVTRANYTFGGWYENSQCTGTEVTAISALDTGNKTYYAKWTPTTYNITYELAGGTDLGNPITYNYESNLITLNNPTREGYTFAGWTGTGLTDPTMTVTIPAGSSGDRTYTATWTLMPYTITYALDGGSVTGNPTTYNIESGTITLINPTKTGYTFTGWTGSNGNTPSASVTIPAGSTGDKNYTAHFSEEGYTITYNYAGGTATNPASYNVQSADFTLNNPTREGYTFAGWTGTGLTDPTMTVTIPTGSSGDRIYTATWTLDTYRITYTLDGGSANNPATYNVNTNTFTLNNPTKTGYTFTGWSGTGLIGNDNMTVTISKGSTGDREYTAHFNATNYTATLDKNNGTGGSDTVGVTYNSAIPNITVPTRTGYTFQGYYRGDTQYINADGTSAHVWDIPQNTTLTAQWTVNSYSVTLNPNGGTINAGNVPSYTYGTGVALPTNVTKDNCSFDGWYDNSECTGTRVYSITNTDTGDKQYWAKWTALPAGDFPVTLNPNGGMIAAGKEVTSYTEGQETVLPTASDITKDGYTFGGWFENADFTGEVVAVIPTTATGAKIYYAKWTTPTPPPAPSPSPSPSPTPTPPEPAPEEYVVPVSNESTVDISVIIEDGNATIADITPEDIATITDPTGDPEQDKPKDILIDVSGATQKVNEVTIKTDTVNTLADACEQDNGIDSVTIRMTDSVVTLDTEAVSSIASQATGDEVSIIVEDSDISSLTEEQQKALETYEDATVMKATVESGGETINDFGNGTATVSRPFEPAEGKDLSHYHAFYLAPDGTMIRCVTWIISQVINYLTGHFSDYVIVYDESMTNDSEIAILPENVKRNVDGTLTFTDEAMGGAYVSSQTAKAGAVYRLYNPNTREHFYTTNSLEVDDLVSLGWIHEEETDYTATGCNAEGARPIYRMYNPYSGLHHFTMDRYEAVCLSRIGWNYEGIVCYSLDKDSTKGTAVYRLYNPNDEQHLYTTDSWEAGALEVFGWMREGVAWRI